MVVLHQVSLKLSLKKYFVHIYSTIFYFLFLGKENRFLCRCLMVRVLWCVNFTYLLMSSSENFLGTSWFFIRAAV